MLLGSWQRRGFAYAFRDSASLQVRRTGAPGSVIRGEYSWFRMGAHDCIAFRAGRPVRYEVEALLIGAVTDSTAIIALGTPFVRADSSRGLFGKWKHLESFERLEWNFGPETAQYRSTVFEPLEGRERTVEERIGTYRGTDDPETGGFAIDFTDGAQAVVLPVVYRDLMYLFDLSPGKSFFVRERPAPAGSAENAGG